MAVNQTQVARLSRAAPRLKQMAPGGAGVEVPVSSGPDGRRSRRPCRARGRAHCQLGFTLIEVTLVALVITVITVLAVPRVRSLIIENRVNSVARELLSAVGTIRGSREGLGTTAYAGIAVAELGAVLRSSSYSVTGSPATAVTHAIGAGGAASVTISQATLPSGSAGDSFSVTLARVDRSACTKLALIASTDAEIITITPVGGGSATSTVKAFNGSFNPTLAQSACDASDDGSAVTITFR